MKILQRPILLGAVAAGLLLAGCGAAPGPSATRRTAPTETSHPTSGSAETSQPAPGPSDAAGVTGGAVFGGNEPLVADTPSLGRRLALVRTYYRIGEPFPDPTDRSLMEQGTSLVVSLDLQPGMTYAAVTGGNEDAAITSFLRALAASAQQYGLKAIYFCFEHEPDTTLHGADPTGFVQAWDHVHQLATTLGVNWQQGGPVHWVWILTHRAYLKGVEREYWPGASSVDVVGVDAYNTAGCKKAAPGSNYVATATPESPTALFGSALSFAESQDKPLFITEWGSVPGPASTSRSQFIQAVAAYVAAHKDIDAALYWDGHGHDNGCDYSIDGDQATLSALGAAGSSAPFRGAVTGAPSEST